MENLYDLIQIMNRRLGLLNKNCCQVNEKELTPVLSHILYEVNRQGNPSMQQVAETLGTDITTFSRQVSTLIKMSLIEKNPDKNDRRIYLLSLSKEGKEFFLESKSQMDHYLDDVLSNMNSDEKQQVLSAFKLFNEKMALSDACCRPVQMNKKTKDCCD